MSQLIQTPITQYATTITTQADQGLSQPCLPVMSSTFLSVITTSVISSTASSANMTFTVPSMENMSGSFHSIVSESPNQPCLDNTVSQLMSSFRISTSYKADLLPQQQYHVNREEVHQQIYTDNECTSEISSTNLNDIITAIESQISTSLNKLIPESINSSIAVYNQRLSDAEASIRQLKDINDSFESDLIQANDEIIDLNKRLTELEAESNKNEQYSRKGNIKITGVEETEHEDCKALVLEVAQRIEANISNNDIDVAHRIGLKIPGRKRALIVKFNTNDSRQSMIKNRKKLAKSGIAIHEDATVKNVKLMKTVRNMDFVKDCWMFNGKIFCSFEGFDSRCHRTELDINSNPHAIYQQLVNSRSNI